MTINKKNKKRMGMTLAELLIALLVLMLITGPILGVFVMSTRISAASRKLTIATFTAQLLMEELVGLTITEMRAKKAMLESSEQNNFPVEIEIGNAPIIEELEYKNLISVTVTVYDSNGTSVLCKQENYLNIEVGGIG